MKKFRSVLRKLVHNPYLDLSLGAILVLSGLSEEWSSIGQDLTNFNLKLHHGVMVFGLVTAFRAVVNIFAGLEFMDEAEYEESRKK